MKSANIPVAYDFGDHLGRQLFYRLGLLFFLLMLVIPTTYQLQRGVILAVLLMGCMVQAFFGSWRLHRAILLWSLLTLTTSLAFMLLGAINAAPGALSVGTVYVLWPTVFLFFIGILNCPKQLFPFLKVIVIASIGVALMAIMLVADNLFGFNLGVATLLEKQGAALGIYDGVIEYNLYNMTTAIYALPFLLGSLLMPRLWSPFKGKWRMLAWIALIFLLITLLISGRRAFWLIAAISPFVVFGLLWLVGMRANLLKWILKGSVIAIVAMVVMMSFLNLDFSLIWENFIDGFDFTNSANISSSRRNEQFNALIDAWMNSPILGAGHGAAAIDNINVEKQPWTYELSYIALLFQTGLLGILIYGSAVMWVFIQGIQTMRSRPESAALLIPTLSGLACFLVANATNPYLQKFDYLWTLFLPIAVLNAYLLRINH